MNEPFDVVAITGKGKLCLEHTRMETSIECIHECESNHLVTWSCKHVRLLSLVCDLLCFCKCKPESFHVGAWHVQGIL